MTDWGNLEGLIPIFGGIYGLLMAKGVLPRHPKDPEKMALWRRKFGGMMTVLCPFLILFGLAQVFGVFRAARGPDRNPVSGKPRQVSLDELGFSTKSAPGVSKEIHRSGAGTLDESGWCHATSTGGGFSVSVPNLFNDFTVTTKAEDGVEIKLFVLGTRDERMVKFVALGIHRSDGSFQGDPLEGFAEQFEKQGDLRDKRPIALGDIPGIELRVANRSSSAVFRLYKGPTTLYQLIVEAPSTTKPQDIEEDGKRFMDSFAVPKN